MLASGAHVKIGDKEFRVKFDIEGAYNYSLNTLGEQVDYWLMDDWSGGEGGDSYDPLDESVYYQGLVNPRKPGVLTTPPAMTTTSSSTPTYAPFFSKSVVSDGNLWLIGSAVDTSGYTHYAYTTDYSSISYKTGDTSGSAWNAAVDTIVAAASDGSDLYLVGQDNRGGTPSYSYEIRRLQAGASATDNVSLETYANTSNAYTIAGAVIKDSYLYVWNGNKLMEWDISEYDGTAAVSPRQKKKIGARLSGLVLNVDYWADIINAEDSIFFFLGLDGRTTIYERDANGAISEVWNLPSGFTGRGIGYSNGALLVAGDYNSQACMFGMSTISRQPIFLGFIRPDSNVTLQHVNPGYGAEVIIGEKGVASATHTFIYDISTDSFSELDSFSVTGGMSLSAGVFAGKRYQVVEDGTNWHIKSWDYDDVVSTTVNGRMETGVWDMDLPEEEKQLDGFHVLSNANSTRTVDIYYQDNEDGVWTTAGTATTGYHNYIQVSDATSTVKFRSLRFRVDPKTGAEVYAVSARIRVNTYEEVWELLLDLTDEDVDQDRSRRKRSTRDKGWQLRQYIRDIADNKTVVTFLDGCPYPQGEGDDPDKYNTHTVIVDIPVDRITKPGEGTMLVRLRSVAVN